MQRAYHRATSLCEGSNLLAIVDIFGTFLGYIFLFFLGIHNNTGGCFQLLHLLFEVRPYQELSFRYVLVGNTH